VKESRCTRISAAMLLLIATPVLLSAQRDPTVDWIRTNAIRLATPEAGHGFSDMQPLKKLIGDARIVSLGEATHGTREFFQLKHRMLEFLATEMGFTVFSIEANMPEAYRLNDYVLNGTGDPAQLLRGMYFWTWNTEEVLDMIKWMREYNASGRGRLQFTGFDMQTHTVALDIVQQFVAQYDPAYADTVRLAGPRVQGLTGASTAAASFGVVTGVLPADSVRGKTIRYSGFIKTENVAPRYAGLWWRVDGAPGTPSLGFDNMDGRGATGTTDWKQFSIELRVDTAARRNIFGMLMPGDGTAWFDDLALEIDGKSLENSSQFDFTFESNSVRGFVAGGAGYRITIDSTVSHGGRRSLRMQRVAPPTSTAPTNTEAMRTGVVTWVADIVTHLERNRASYRAKGAPVRDIEWAIQNARVVRQAVEMRTNRVDRDQAMAMNVKWILDQNPAEKVVLWAHNGHVAGGRMMLSRSMGEHLRTMYGSQMVVFGFGFNRGGFQAINMGGGGLQNFTVGPAPDGSFDAVLGAAGIPVFALDLRNAPAALREVRQSRQVGSGFVPASEANYLLRFAPPDVYDAILFVENTTAARPNPRR
jgi:erythromycin esterase-like protein